MIEARSMKNKISIALATYNGERHLKAQLDSFLRQTRLPDELVISDDHSLDKTPAILANFAARAPFPVIFSANPNNLGYAANFSNALTLCTGDIVLPSDQDDVWLPTKIEAIERFFAEHPTSLLVIHDIEFCKEDLTPIGQTKIQRMRDGFDLTTEYVVGMASALRGDFLRLCLPIPECDGLSHDKWLHMCANAMAGKDIMEDVLVLYRRHDACVTSGSKMNVDYVTGIDHFKPRQVDFRARLARMPLDNRRKWAQSSMLLAWLESNRESLVRDGHADPVRLGACIANERKRRDAGEMRQSILEHAEAGCLVKLTELYRLGGYAFFRGWKSALGDLVFRCLLRL